MKAILTKVIPCTNTKPTRVSAKAEGGHRIVISYDGEESHLKAAQMLALEMNWQGKWIKGNTPEGYVFVCEQEQSQYNYDFFVVESK